MVITSTRAEKRRLAKMEDKVNQYNRSNFSANEFTQVTLENRNKYHPHIGAKERNRYEKST